LISFIINRKDSETLSYRCHFIILLVQSLYFGVSSIREDPFWGRVDGHLVALVKATVSTFSNKVDLTLGLDRWRTEAIILALGARKAIYSHPWEETLAIATITRLFAVHLTAMAR